MTFDQLRVFIVVAELQHITRAAAALHMTQSAVSAAIASLEHRHGVQLFDRVGRSILLNQAGRAFLHHARAVLQAGKAAESVLADLAELRVGDLTIMASQTIVAHWLPARLARYHARHPGIRLSVTMGNTGEVAAAVADGGVEIGLVEGEVARPELDARVIATDDMIVVAAPDHPHQGPLDSIAFAAVRWVLREEGSGTRRSFQDAAGRLGLRLSDLTVAMVLPGNEAVLGAVEAGVGLTLTSRSVAAARLAAGLVREVDFPAQPRPFFLLRHSERYRSRAAAAFEAVLAESIEAASPINR